MASPSRDSVVDTRKKVKRRGPTVKKNAIRKRSKGIVTKVKWNAKGQPIGDKTDDFIGYIGTTVRQMVPIIVEDERNEDLDPLKENIWRDIKTTFDVDDTRETFVLQEAGKLHLNFRSYLTKHYLKDEDGIVLSWRLTWCMERTSNMERTRGRANANMHACEVF